MIGALEAGIPLVAAASSAAVAWVLARRRGDAVLQSTTKLLGGARIERESAVRRAVEAEDEALRWRGMSLAGASLSSAREPVYASRPAPRDAIELAQLARGLALVDDVMIADAEGLPMIAELDAGSTTLAAIAAPSARAIRVLGAEGLAVSQLAYESFSAEHVTVRALPGRADGLFLVLKTTSQRANPLVLDAVVHAAARNVESAMTTLPFVELGGTTEMRALEQPLFGEVYGDLVKELKNDVRAIVLTLDGRAVFSAASNGPSEDLRILVASELSRLQLRVAHLLQASPLARVEITLRDKTQLTWSALAPRSRLAILTVGRIDDRTVERLAGRIRRIVDAGAEAKAA